MGELQLNNDGPVTYFFDEPDVMSWGMKGLPVSIAVGDAPGDPVQEVLRVNLVTAYERIAQLERRIEALERAAEARDGDG